jgi:hypothetical protein
VGALGALGGARTGRFCLVGDLVAARVLRAGPSGGRVCSVAVSSVIAGFRSRLTAKVTRQDA